LIINQIAAKIQHSPRNEIVLKGHKTTHECNSHDGIKNLSSTNL